MNDRRKVLELFEQQKEYTDKRISEGIEKYRKGNAEIIVTDKNGICSFRGFYGDYELEFEVNGKTIKKTVLLSSKSDNKIKVVL